jgi:RNA polymerase sigma factor (sigma-70 family)
MHTSEPISEKTSPEVAKTLLNFQQTFLSFLERRVGNRAEAEEILQSAFMKSLEKNTVFHDTESIIAWFYRVLRNALIDHYRKTSARERGQERHALEMIHLTQQEDPEVKAAVCQCVMGLLPTLKPEYSSLLQHVDLEDEPLEEAARGLGITPGNGRVRLHRARRALRARVEESCGMCATHGCLDCQCKSKV